MSEKGILLEVEDGIGVIRLNRLESLNALDHSLLQDLEAAVDRTEGDPQVRVVVLASSSPRAFIAGAHIRELASQDPSMGEAFSRSGHELLHKLETMQKALIAAVNGYCLGGGLELALACDFIYASDEARFGMPEVTIGTIPGFGGTQTLRSLIGPNRARELILSGRLLSSQEALEWGIVNRIFPTADLMDAVLKTARMIADNDLTAVGYAKQAIASGSSLDRESALRLESSLFGRLCGTEGRRTRMQAFLEKKKPAGKKGGNGRSAASSDEPREERRIGNGI